MGTVGLRQTATMLAAFYMTALVLGADGLRRWTAGGEEGTPRLALAKAAESWAGALEWTGASVLAETLAAEATVWIGRIAEGTGSGDGAQLAGLLAATELSGMPPAQAADATGVSPQPRATSRQAKRQPASPPAASSAATQSPAALPEATTQTVLLVGDSLMAVGLAQGIAKAAAGNPRYRIVRGYRCATGLSRPDHFDWPRAAERLVARHQPAFIIVAIGGNDAQGFREHGEVLRFASPAWDIAYRNRVGEFLKVMRAGGARVLWVGTPVMRSSAFTTSMGRLNKLVQEAMRGVDGCTYLDSTPLIASADGKFATYLTDGQRHEVKVRADDGVHMTPSGGARIASGVWRWLTRVDRVAPR